MRRVSDNGHQEPEYTSNGDASLYGVRDRDDWAETVILRDYQQEALQAIVLAYGNGVWSQLIVHPTGSGKTVLFSQLIQAFDAVLLDRPWLQRRMLVIAHRDELIEQAASKLRAANPDLCVEIEQAGREATPMADVVVASIQTLAAKQYRRLDAMGVDRFAIIVYDEVHHAASETGQGVLRRLGVLPPEELLPVGRDALALHTARVRVQEWWQTHHPGKLLLGVTATPSRSDAVGLEWMFRQVVHQVELRAMIEQGYLVPPRGYVVETGLNLDTVKTIGGDFQQKGLSSIVNTVERNQAIAAAWMDKAQGRPTLVFGVDVQHAKDLALAFQQYDVDAEAIDGTATRQERYETLRSFQRGEIRVLCNCALFTEGFDEPRIACIVQARPTQSTTLYQQMIGRGLRLYEGKTDCVVLDGVDNSSRHSLITLGDLFGLPSRFNLNGRDVAQTAARMQTLVARNATLDLTGIKTLDELEARIRTIDFFTPRTSPTVQAHAGLCWRADSSGARFHLPITEQPALSLMNSRRVAQVIEIRQQTLGDWIIVVKGGESPDYHIGSTDDVKDAFVTAERWLKAHHPSTVLLQDKQAAWRKKPPTAKQVTKLQELGCTRIPATRGDASEMLSAFMQRKLA